MPSFFYLLCENLGPNSCARVPADSARTANPQRPISISRNSVHWPKRNSR